MTGADFGDRSSTRGASRHQRGVALIDADVDSGFIGHSYFYANQAVLSDLILILRDDRDPEPNTGGP